MTDSKTPTTMTALEAPVRAKKTNYPPEYAERVQGREKRPLGDVFGLVNFGVNLTRLAPGSMSALRHAHSVQEEFIYVLAGHPTLVTDEGETSLAPGMCAGFRAGTGNGHHLINNTDEDALYLELGDRTAGDSIIYPDDDIRAVFTEGAGWQFTHKDGRPY